MAAPIQSVIDSGSKVWLDSVNPAAIARQRGWGITGATSNPVIIHDLIESGEEAETLARYLDQGISDEDVAWNMTDLLVRKAQDEFIGVWESTQGNDGYVSFELDPLLEDPEADLPFEDRVDQYVALGQKWGEGHANRMIKVPNTEAGRAALEPLAAAGVTINVTLTFTMDQYVLARDAIWRGAQKHGQMASFKSVYSIFVSRVDAWTNRDVPGLSEQAQGQVGIANAKKIWKMNQDFWADKNLPLQQEIIFASTTPKLEGDPPWKYVEAFTGSDIITNPPENNDRIQHSERIFSRQVDQMPAAEVIREIEQKVSVDQMHKVLMEEGINKFADPQKDLLRLVAKKRQQLEKSPAQG